MGDYDIPGIIGTSFLFAISLGIMMRVGWVNTEKKKSDVFVVYSALFAPVSIVRPQPSWGIMFTLLRSYSVGGCGEAFFFASRLWAFVATVLRRAPIAPPYPAPKATCRLSNPLA